MDWMNIFITLFVFGLAIIILRVIFKIALVPLQLVWDVFKVAVTSIATVVIAILSGIVWVGRKIINGTKGKELDEKIEDSLPESTATYSVDSGDGL